MASVPAELSLDYTPNTYSMIQKQIPEQQQQQPANSQKIQEFLVRLEEERNKIEAFKRELPLCMQLLNDAIECYKQQLETTTRHAKQGAARPVLEEFMPLKNMNVDGGEEGAVNVTSEKPSWMLSSHLWIQTGDVDAAEKQVPLAPAKKLEAEQAIDVSPRLALDAKQRNGGAFLPFSKEKNRGGARTAAAAPPCALPELALASSEKAIEETKCVEAESGGTVNGRRENGGGAESHPKESHAAPSPPAHRKARRCWSPDLHRRFVNALQILGGSQVATPKQIRELMKVDGLTNDEVKSHLQKYRLHTRRPAPVPQAAATAPQLVVLGVGGIWVPPEYATSAAAPAIYGAHPGAAHYCAATPVPQEFYSTVAPVPQQHHRQLHPQLKLPRPPTYKARAGESPESEARSSGERSESMVEEEEGESEGEDEETEEREGKAALPAVKGEDKF